MTGVVKFFDRTKGYGFILPHDGSADVFFHESALGEGGKCATGQEVEFELYPLFPKPRALAVRLLSKRSYEVVQRKVAYGD